MKRFHKTAYNETLPLIDVEQPCCWREFCDGKDDGEKFLNLEEEYTSQHRFQPNIRWSCSWARAILL